MMGGVVHILNGLRIVLTEHVINHLKWYEFKFWELSMLLQGTITTQIFIYLLHLYLTSTHLGKLFDLMKKKKPIKLNLHYLKKENPINPLKNVNHTWMC